MSSYCRVAAGTLCVALLVMLPSGAAADAARVESLGGVGLFAEDPSFAFTNPSLIGIDSNRVWFSVGVTGGGGTLGFDPHGGASVSIKDTFTLGLALNRSPTLYGFGAALWPVALAYLPEGPGGPLEGADGPVETSEPLRFPLDLFLGFGDENSKTRFGMNFYYAGGSSRAWDIDDSDQDELQQESVVRTQTHLFNATLGLSGGTLADRIRPQVWARVGNLSSWQDTLATSETAPNSTDTVIDRVLALDRDLRVGAGFRVLLGDAASGLVVTPGLSYDFATGSFRFDDNMVSPDSRAEHATRETMAHDLMGGVGLTWRGDGLLVQGSVGVGLQVLQKIDSVEVADDEFQQTGTMTIDLRAPEVAIGAEYELLPVLVVRAGLRSSVIGGRSSNSVTQGVGEQGSPTDFAVSQSMQAAPVAVAVDATAGLGLVVKRFRMDAIVGGAFLGEGTPNLLSRVDMSFSFD